MQSGCVTVAREGLPAFHQDALYIEKDRGQTHSEVAGIPRHWFGGSGTSQPCVPPVRGWRSAQEECYCDPLADVKT